VPIMPASQIMPANSGHAYSTNNTTTVQA